MRHYLLAVLVAVAGCSDLTAPNGAIPILPIPEQYRVWWDAMEVCSGFRGDIDDIDFYIVEQVYHGKQKVAGQSRMLRGSRSQIVLTAGRENHHWVVRHEMMHVLGGKRLNNHPIHYFGDRHAVEDTGVCGNLFRGP